MFGLTTTRRCMAEQTKIYTLGKAYGYVDALKELSRNIQVETDVRRSENSDPVNGKYWEGWTLESFVKWLEGETIRMMRSKEISSTEFMDQIVRLQRRMDKIARNMGRRG
ncbi:hypothetical protein GJ25_gp101 [Mycobacterium phage Hawkeye]|uniref:Uncharacterized protein n=1 Tax=Mycobacterium phage Hawkeye TaxID=1458711 RepID=X2KNB8_9CAUD|nr:hypothetical protein GJ25_gp101 [Mycobacterium phage Hawkeye]AHN84112.1 hypothetical protein PBI_HAWKEYE_101 [Mycobacterium phage Hawkeye]